MSQDVPRHPLLDEELAVRSASRELLQVYGDWLLEQHHPLGEQIRDGALAEAGDAQAARRVRVRLAELEARGLQALAYTFTCGLPTAVTWDLRFAEGGWGWALQELGELWTEPLAALCASVCVRLPHDPGEEHVLLEVLSTRPPSVGALSVLWPLFPMQDGQEPLDLGIAGPPVRRLHVRAHAILGLPSLAELRHLDLATYDAPAIAPLPHLQTARLWEGLPDSLVAPILASPQLKSLSVYGDGPIERVLGWPWESLPQSLRQVELFGALSTRPGAPG